MKLATVAEEFGGQPSSVVASSYAGDLEYIVRQHSPALVRTLTLVVLDRELAADITQDRDVRGTRSPQWTPCQ